MNVFNSKKSSVIKSIILISTVLAFSNVYAQSSSGNHDGGLMKQMMNEKYQPQVITDPDAQARLRQVVIADTSHQNSGLMKQMTLAKYQPKAIIDLDAQVHLRKVVITETGHQNGGLMKQMRQQMIQQ